MCTKTQSLSKIKEIARLRNNWNGYNAEGGRSYPLNKAVAVLEIISTLEEKYGDNIYPEVFPTAYSTIQFEWDTGTNYLEFEIKHATISVMNVLNKEYHNAFSQEYSYDKPSEPFKILERYLLCTGHLKKE